MLEKSYIHHLKALMCGINASRGQGHGCRFTMCHTSLKMALLLHTEGLVKTALASTVAPYCSIFHLGFLGQNLKGNSRI